MLMPALNLQIFDSLNLFDEDCVHHDCQMMPSPTEALGSHCAGTKSRTAHTQFAQRTHVKMHNLSKANTFQSKENTEQIHFKVRCLNRIVKQLLGLRSQKTYTN